MDGKTIFRGFYENKNGTKTITINGAQIKGEWAKGYYCFRAKRRGAFGQTITEADFDRHYIVQNDGRCFEVHPKTIGQYIGLTDESGNKIFTGDKFVPYYVTPMGERTNELDYYNKGIVKAGTAEYYLNGEKIGSTDLIFSENCREAGYMDCLEKVWGIFI